MLHFKILNELYLHTFILVLFCLLGLLQLSRLSLLLSMLGCMGARGVLAQNRTIPNHESKLYADCQSYLTIMVLTELKCVVVIISDFEYNHPLFSLVDPFTLSSSPNHH